MTAKRERQPQTETTADRLERVRTEIAQIPTLQEFWERLTQHRPGETGEFQVSYPSVRNYHSDREPPVSYLVRVADRFGVRLEWLATGRGEPTVGAERQTERAMTYADLYAQREIDDLAVIDQELGLTSEWVEKMSERPNREQRGSGEVVRMYSRRSAIRRFGDKLRVSEVPGSPWSLAGHHELLLRGAARFLLGVQGTLDELLFESEDGERLRPMFDDMTGASMGRYNEWHDAILSLYSRRIIGLGEEIPHERNPFRDVEGFGERYTGREDGE